jgi:hypothetical protein
VIRRTVGVAFTLAGVACALTLVYLAMRSVMDVGGYCAEGGPYTIRQHCPQGVPAVMVGSILGGIVLAFVYVGLTLKSGIPSFAALLWPALFLSLGWNFLEYAFDSPLAGGGIVWGWLVCGVVFALMGGLPLLVALPLTIRSFTRGDHRPAGWRVGSPSVHIQRVAARARPAEEGAGGIVDELERLEALRRRGSITDQEFEAAKSHLLRQDTW